MPLPIPIIGSLVDSVVGYFTMSKEAKNKIKSIKETAKVNKVKRADDLIAAKEQAQIDKTIRNDNAETGYDLIALENAKVSFFDELMIGWVLCIITMIFIPSMQPYVINGFKALDEHVPTWFQLVFVGGFISKLGLRFLFSGRTLFGGKVP